MIINNIGTIGLYDIFNHIDFTKLIDNDTVFCIYHWKKEENEEAKELVDLFLKYGVDTNTVPNLDTDVIAQEFYKDLLLIDLDGEWPRVMKYKKEGQEEIYKFFRKYRQLAYAKFWKVHNNKHYWDENT